MQIFNYTGKYITVSGEHGIRETLPPDGHAKTTIKHSKKTVVGFVTIFKKEYGRIENLPSPDPRREKLYIVNQDVAEAAQPRFDLLVPENPQSGNNVTFYNLVNI